MTLVVFLVASLIGGANVGLVKFGVLQFPPIVLVAARAILAAIIIFPFLNKQKILTLRILNKDLMLTGILFAANWIFFAFGAQHTSAIMSQVIYVPTALLVAILGYFLLKEKLTKNQIIGLVVTITGMSILIISSFRTKDILSFGTPLGNFLIVLGLFSWSFYIVLSRKISQKYSPLTILFFDFIITAAFALVLLPIQLILKPIDSNLITFEGIMSVFALALFSSAAFFFLYQWLIKHTSAFISSLLIYPVTVVSALIGLILFNESVNTILISGALLTMVGVFYSTGANYIKKWI